MGRCLISELLELLLGASGLCDFGHVETHSLAQGLALAHCDNVTNLDIPAAGGQVHGHVLVDILKEVVPSGVVASFSKQDPLLIVKDGWLLSIGTLSLHIRHLARRLKQLEDKF